MLPVQVPVSDLEKMAMAIAKSNLFGVKEPTQALALMLIAQAEGMHPAIAARDYDIIQGRPAKKTEAMLRSFLDNQGKVEWITLDDEVAEAKFSHPQGGSVTIKWDMKRAEKAGLASRDMWRKYPRQMLRSRCVSEGIKTTYPGATSGMYTPEEVRDFEEPQEIKNVTPPKIQEIKPVHPVPNDLKADLESLKEGTKTKTQEHIEQLKAAIEKIAKKKSITIDEATQRCFDDATGKMTFEKIDKLKTETQLLKVREALVRSTTIILEAL